MFATSGTPAVVTINTDWTGIPHTHKNANRLTHEAVRNARVVRLARATIRSSIVSGVFKLAQDAVVTTHARGRRIEVECLWFGRKPPKTWMHVTLLCEPIFENNYTGEVVVNIGR